MNFNVVCLLKVRVLSTPLYVSREEIRPQNFRHSKKCNNSTIFLNMINFSDIQDDLKRNALCQLKVHDLPIQQCLLFAIVHDSPDLVSKPIKSYENPKLTPFTCWPAGGNPVNSLYQEVHIEKIGLVFGCIIRMNQENIVNFKFPLLSSDCRSK